MKPYSAVILIRSDDNQKTKPHLSGRYRHLQIRIANHRARGHLTHDSPRHVPSIAQSHVHDNYSTFKFEGETVHDAISVPRVLSPKPGAKSDLEVTCTI